MSFSRGSGDRRASRRNGLTGASRRNVSRSAAARGTSRSRRPEAARGGGRSAAGDLTRASGRGRGPGDKRSTRGPGPTRATAETKSAQRWTARLTGRAILLAAVVVLLVVSLAYPLQRYLAQQAAIDSLEAENLAAQQRVEDLRRQVDLLDDPAFIQTQARSRLQYVMPGDLLYVIDDSGQALAVPGQDAPAAEEDEEEVPWYEAVLDSIDRADSGG